MMADLLADVDAININGFLGSSSVGDALSSYYSSGYKTRYTDFVESIAGKVNKGSFKGWVDDYTNDYYYTKKWPLLEGVTVTNNQSWGVRDAFTDYIWDKVQAEK